jgi:hypothetical protein
VTSHLPAGMRADLRELVHILAEMLDCARVLPLVESKACSSCRRIRPAQDFNRDRYRKDGLRYRCRTCDKTAAARRVRAS